MKNLLIILSLGLLTLGCNSQESTIKKDLATRFTGFEIVKIKPDSANVWDAFNLLNSLRVSISEGNLKIVKAENNYYDKKWSFKKTSAYMDSITSELNKHCMEFMYLKFSKKELCYYVKYRIFKEELKIEKEEYYYLREYGDKNEIEAIHRPCNWNEYLSENGYSDLLDRGSEYYLKFLRDIVGKY